MKISPKDPSVSLNEYVKQVSQKQKADASAEPDAKEVVKADTIKISKKARELQEAIMELEKLADVQAKKVDKLKNQIEKGTYEVKSGKLAEKIVIESLLNEIL